MKIGIFLKENNSLVESLEVRKGTKNTTINDKIKELISKKYNCTIRRSLPTGKIDFATGKQDISYVLFGENLPFRNYYFEEIL